MSPRSAAIVLAAGLTAAALTGCASSASAPPPPPASASPTPSSSLDLGECATQFLTTVTAGQLTVGVPTTSAAPYIATERNSKARIGLEAEVAVAIAGALGLPRTAVFWEPVEIDPAAPVVPLTVDFVIGQLPIQPAGVATAAFSAPYLDVRHVVVAVRGSQAASAGSVADLTSLRLAAVVGGRGPMAADSALRPTIPTSEVDSPEAAVAGLRSGAFDAVVLDVVSAGRLVSDPDSDLVIVGQLPASVGDPALGLAFAPGNPLLACVDRAIAETVADGAIEASTARWLGEGAIRPLTP